MASPVQFVADPFVDTGVAVLEYRIGKSCADFTRAELSKQAEELDELYSQKAWTGYLTVHFPNSCWCNATMGPDKKRQQKDALLNAFDSRALTDRACSYCGRVAQRIADRSNIPLLTGAATMTAGPGGEPGLPVCAACLFAIQFYPLATLKVNGRPLFWWTPQHDWMYYLTSDFANRVAQVTAASPEQVPSIGWPSTRLLETAETVVQSSKGTELAMIDLIGCHVTNYGSGPDYSEIRVKSGVLDFLRIAKRYSAYRIIRDVSWESEKPKSRKGPAPAAAPTAVIAKRNFFFEDIGSILRREGAKESSLIRRYFTPQAGREPGVFELACHFARKVLEMTQEQVCAIKDLAAQIANSKRAEEFVGRLFQRRGLTNYVRTLTEISDRMKRAGEAPLSTDTILRAFDLVTEDDASPRDADMVRELIVIRLIEVLPQERLKDLPEVTEEKQEQN